MAVERHPRVGTAVCAKCRAGLSPGDRVTIAYIVDVVSSNPANVIERGAWLQGGEFELVHVDCSNPGLDPAAGRIGKLP